MYWYDFVVWFEMEKKKLINISLSFYLSIFLYNMEIYISESMLRNDKLEKLLVKDVYFLSKIFCYIT